MTHKQLKSFFDQPGINKSGVCKEARVTQQNLNRRLAAGELPGPRVLARLLSIMIKYGWKT